MGDENYKVTSEIYAESDYCTSEKTTLSTNYVATKFKFKYPPCLPRTDKDGDLIVQRKTSKDLTQQTNYGVIEIEHHQTTALDLVGLQIWRGALLLADWLLHNGGTFSKDSVLLELGSGVGLTSIIAAIFCPVVCTDIDKGGILDLIEKNVSRNTKITKHPIKVLELDFTNDKLSSCVEEALNRIEIVIAADVVYDDRITEAFVNTVEKLLSKPPKRVVYIALEKRYVFTIADCDTVAPCYEHFIQCMKKLKNVSLEEVALDFPKYFQYDRVKELVLWKVTSRF